MQLLGKRRTLAASHIGGIKNTAEVLELCAKHGLIPDVELITADQLDWAWDKLNTGTAKGKRYVIDIKESLKNPDFLPK